MGINPKPLFTFDLKQKRKWWVMDLIIGKRYNIKTKDIHYLNYRITDYKNKQLKIESVDGKFTIDINEVTEAYALGFLESLKIMPKRIVIFRTTK